ncbi:MAG: hypothetical protein R6V00_06230 [Candidatus Aminicenantes bacterium]
MKRRDFISVRSLHPDVIQRIEQIMKNEDTPSEIDRFKFPQLGD